MSAQESIIFFYKNGQSNTLPFTEFTAKAKQVIPHNVTILKQSLVPNGGLVFDLAYEKSANFLEGQTCKDKLKTLNLTAFLTADTKRTRLVYLKNVPEEIYSKDIGDITEELVKITKKLILEVNKFPGKHDRKYITFLADCRSSRDSIVREGPLKLFGKYVVSELPIAKGQAGSYMRAHTDHGPKPIDQARPTHRRPDFTCPPPPRTNAWHRNHTQPQPQAYRHTQGRNDPFTPPSEITRPRNSQIGMIRPPDFRSEIDRNIYTQMIENIGKTLQGGIENPEDYINILNSINTHHGLFTIFVPKDQLVLARDKFLSKSNNINTCMTNDPHPNDSMLNDTQPPNSLSMEIDTDQTNSVSIQNPTDPPHSLTNPPNPSDMTSDTDIDLSSNLSNANHPSISPSHPDATDLSIPPTNLSIPPSMQIITDPATNTSMTNESDPQNTPSMSNDTHPQNLTSMPNDSESSTPSSMTKNTNIPVPTTTPARSTPKSLPSTPITSSTPSSMTKNTNSLVSSTPPAKSLPKNPSLTSATSPIRLRIKKQNQKNQINQPKTKKEKKQGKK